MNNLEFIDLYAGIGGIRFAFENNGAKCVFSSEWNKFAQKTYKAFHGETPVGDISLVDFKQDIPNHDILTAGFPCQPFSLAGVSKKNSLGRSHGFKDPTQGTEFFKIKQILKIKKPSAFLLENVKNLKSHDKYRTFREIENSLDEVGYDFTSVILDAKHWVPQHRERIYIIGFRKKFELKKYLEELAISYPKEPIQDLSDLLIPEKEIRQKYGHKYTLTPGTWNALQKHRNSHLARGNGFGYGSLSEPFDGKVTRTMSARYYKDGGEILIEQKDTSTPRKILPLEACRLQGFPKKCEKFFDGTVEQPVSDLQTYKQFGNSVAVPVVAVIAKIIIEKLNQIKT